MIGNRIKPIEDFDAVSLSTSPVDDAPTNCRQANYLRRLCELHGPLDIDFQGIEAKINITDSRVNHCDCAVMLGMSERVGIYRLARHNIFL